MTNLDPYAGDATSLEMKGPVVVLLMIFLLVPGISRGDSAAVLPRGVTRLALDSKFYFPVRQYYDRRGHIENLGTDYSATLGSNVFHEVALLEAGFGMPWGSAAIGRSEVSMKYQFTTTDVSVQYGLTDRLSVGASLTLSTIRNRVTARIDTSAATLGINPDLGTSQDRYGTPLIPVTEGGIRDDTLAAGLVQDLLIREYGYRRIQSWSGSGLGDLEAGARYQYRKTPNWRLAYSGGLRFPTGQTDDPDSLVDWPVGDGNYAILLRMHADWTGIENLVLNLTCAYDLTLPGRETMRLPKDMDQPITANRETVHRDPGDGFSADVTASYRFSERASSFITYSYSRMLQDRISGNCGFDYHELESGSGGLGQVIRLGITLSFTNLYKQGRFPLPVDFHLTYRERFAGKNFLKSRYLGVGADCFF
ncbi:MAG: transporter [Pseudomonadota bacterium]